ncbi:MAG TPA: hypothetical protein IAA01_09770 [Candidatus Fournierella excrementavium]|nr:hypothetical protein [Candidatus Fournierella excrementavium]
MPLGFTAILARNSDCFIPTFNCVGVGFPFILCGIGIGMAHILNFGEAGRNGQNVFFRCLIGDNLRKVDFIAGLCLSEGHISRAHGINGSVVAFYLCVKLGIRPVKRNCSVHMPGRSPACNKYRLVRVCLGRTILAFDRIPFRNGIGAGTAAAGIGVGHQARIKLVHAIIQDDSVIISRPCHNRVDSFGDTGAFNRGAQVNFALADIVEILSSHFISSHIIAVQVEVGIVLHKRNSDVNIIVVGPGKNEIVRQPLCQRLVCQGDIPVLDLVDIAVRLILPVFIIANIDFLMVRHAHKKIDLVTESSHPSSIFRDGFSTVYPLALVQSVSFFDRINRQNGIYNSISAFFAAQKRRALAHHRRRGSHDRRGLQSILLHGRLFGGLAVIHNRLGAVHGGLGAVRHGLGVVHHGLGGIHNRLFIRDGRDSAARRDFVAREHTGRGQREDQPKREHQADKPLSRS